MSNYLMIFGKPRYLGLLKDDISQANPGTRVIVESARGEEVSVAAGPITPEQAESYRVDLTANGGDGIPRGGEPSFQDLRFVRYSTEEDLAERASQEKDEESILVKGRELLKSHELEMKLVDVEFLLDRKKLFFYFTAEQRVDFRAYVRDLAREFKTRIELRQIGVRDESKVVKGMSPCGMPCCCSYWLNRFAPICIRMVKEQNLALNPTKISGICGRLMCCMGFEHNNYRELWKDLPAPGSKIKTPTTNYIVSGVDITREMVRIFCPGSGEIMIPIGDFKQFRETVMRGEAWIRESDVEIAKASASENPEETGKVPDGVEDIECSVREAQPRKNIENNAGPGTENERAQRREKQGHGNHRRRTSIERTKNNPASKSSREGAAVNRSQAKAADPVKPEGKKRTRRRRPRKPTPPSSDK